MKPKIYWHSNDEYGLYICQIPEDAYEECFTEEEQYVYMSCGAGKTMREAYESWVEDCKWSSET